MTENINEGQEIQRYEEEPRRKNFHIWMGLFILGIGVVFLLKQSGVLFPDWLFTWPMILIAIGVFSGIKHGFRPGGWIMILLIGGIFLADSMISGISIQQYAWPCLFIIIGLWIMFKPKAYNRNFRAHWRERYGRRMARERNICDRSTEQPDSNDFLDTTSILGGVKKIVLSKNFKGGDITNFMGGTEINFTQADIQSKVTIDTTNIFGGTKIIVPPTWDVQSDIVAIFGGVDDKRQMLTQTSDPVKTIRLSGICIFGGIEIRSF
jgi:predicted membrane protein